MTKIVHSGGARGADSVFSQIFVNNGYQVIHHSFHNHNISSKTGKVLIHSEQELTNNKKILTVVCNNINKKYPNKKYIESLLLRNTFIIEGTRLVLGVGKIIDSKKCIVEGGTGYGVMHAKLRKIPIIFFDQFIKRWMYSVNGQQFIELNRQPNLSNFPSVFSAIGTRKLIDNTVQELRICFQKE